MSGFTAAAVPAVKPEATAVGNSARWPLENNLNGGVRSFSQTFQFFDDNNWREMPVYHRCPSCCCVLWFILERRFFIFMPLPNRDRVPRSSMIVSIER